MQVRSEYKIIACIEWMHINLKLFTMATLRTEDSG